VNKPGSLRHLKVAALCSLLFITPFTYAQDNWYTIEVIVFAHIDEASALEEQWPDDVVMAYPRGLKQLQTPIKISDTLEPEFQNNTNLDLPDFEAQLQEINDLAEQRAREAAELGLSRADIADYVKSLDMPAEPLQVPLEEPSPIATELIAPEEPETIEREPINFELLGKDSYQLATAMGHLRRILRYKPLFHEAWTQNLTDRKRSPSILITGGDEYGKHRELEGSIKISVERYLHVETDLWLHQFMPNFGQTKILQVPDLPLGGQQLGPESSLSSQFDDILKEPYQINRSVTLRQARRMRSKEIHYLDHPMFGMILVITPLDNTSS
jgi:hypothetical protein